MEKKQENLAVRPTHTLAMFITKSHHTAAATREHRHVLAAQLPASAAHSPPLHNPNTQNANTYTLQIFHLIDNGHVLAAHLPASAAHSPPLHT